MSTQQVNISWIATNLSQYSAFIQTVSAALTAVGLQLSSDTGQVDLTNITLPSSLPTTAGSGGYYNYFGAYEIREMVSPGLPTLYLRIDYGIVDANYNSNSFQSYWRPVLQVSVGSATDGAGNLGGVINKYPMQSLGGTNPYSNSEIYSVAPSATLRPLYVASDGANYFTMALDPTRQVTDTTSKSLMAFALERTINPGDGSYNDTGWVQWDMGGNYNVGSSGENGLNGYSITSILSAFTVHTQKAVPSQVPGTLYSSSGSGNSCSIFPVTVMTPIPQGPMTAAIVYFTSDIVAGVQFQVTMYGKLCTYLPLGQNPVGGTYCNPANSANYSPAVRFD